MERSDVEKPAAEDGSQLYRNRSFKSKQLVRSQAIRESQSPPRTVSPSPHTDNENSNNATVNNVDAVATVENSALNNDVVTNSVPLNNVTVICSSERTLCDDDGCGDVCADVISCGDGKECGDELKKQQVEIQITGGGSWDESSEQRQRARRWLGHKHYSESMRDLLSNSPRVACVCGACANCPHCRGRRRRQACPIKQDSGIACSEDCPDCADNEITGGNDGLRKSESVEVEEQTYYCRCPERKEKPKNISLSRTDSEEKMEPTGPELVNFLKETLNKNARDRLTLLKIEKELHALVSDTGRCIVRFPVMTSYGRMLVHRCAALFQLSHHLDHANKTAVLVSKSGTSGGRIPCTSFKAWCTATFPPSPQRHTPPVNAKSILKRDTQSLDEPGQGSLSNSSSRSLEQRERDYERMKRRIFSTDNCSQDESQWPWLAGGPVKLLTPDAGRNKLLKVQSLESSGPPVAGCRGRGAVSKSHSFGGYAGNEPSSHPRVLSRQGDLASSSWRLSPSSSGYKTLSLRSTDSVTPSPTGGASPEPCAPGGPGGAAGGGAVVWCVTDMARVPPGALLIHPQTGRPLANPDGTVYRYDPANPPALYDPANPPALYDPGYPPPDNKIDQNEKKRGKLEKQHSFMDNGECDCQSADETRNKCCCECRRHDPCQQERKIEEKNTPEQKPQKPQSPCKRYEQTNNTTDMKTRTYEQPAIQKTAEQRPNYEPTNQRAVYNAPTNDAAYNYSYANERPPYEAQANQRPASYEPANQREQRVKLTNEGQEMQYGQYGLGMRSDEQVTSPSQPQIYPHHDSITVQQVLQQAKATPAPLPDPNIRPISLTNMVYPTAIPQGYPYMSQCRMDAPIQAVYQPQAPPQTEELKQLAPSPHQEPTFRIDPSYPYAAVDYTAQCGACVDPNAMRSYNVSYGQVEMPQTVIPPAYPVSNVILPQHIQQYPYQEAVQWQGAGLMPLGGVVAPGKLVLPEPYPPPLYHNLYAQYSLLYPQVLGAGLMPLGGVVAPGKLVLPEPYPPPLYHNLYAQYSLLYPQVIPQPYPVCQPVYPAVVEKPPSRRNSVGSQRASTASCTPSIDEHNNNNNINIEKTQNRRNSTEIAVKIQQIKEQMAALNTRPRPRREEWRRRPPTSGTGLLGSHPHTHHQHAHHPGMSNDETQLSTAARAIVNSIRNMQTKTTYQDNRREYNTYNRPDFRRRDRSPDKPDRQDKEFRRPRGPAPVDCRPPYLLRQMSPGTWCRRSPGPVHPVLNHPRRPHPDTRNGRR